MKKMLEIARMCMDCGRLIGCREDKVDGEKRDCFNCEVPSIRTICLTDMAEKQTHGICYECEPKRRKRYGH